MEGCGDFDGSSPFLCFFDGSKHLESDDLKLKDGEPSIEGAPPVGIGMLIPGANLFSRSSPLFMDPEEPKPSLSRPRSRSMTDLFFDDQPGKAPEVTGPGWACESSSGDSKENGCGLRHDRPDRASVTFTANPWMSGEVNSFTLRAMEITKQKKNKQTKGTSKKSPKPARREGEKRKVDIPIEKQLKLMRLRKRKVMSKISEEGATSNNLEVGRRKHRRGSTGDIDIPKASSRTRVKASPRREESKRNDNEERYRGIHKGISPSLTSQIGLQNLHKSISAEGISIGRDKYRNQEKKYQAPAIKKASSAKDERLRRPVSRNENNRQVEGLSPRLDIDDVKIKARNPFSSNPVLDKQARIRKLMRAVQTRVEALPIWTVLDNQMSLRKTNSCGICKKKWSYGDLVVTLLCSHPFHKGCVLRWIKRSPNCPVCKVSILKKKPF